MTRSKVVRRLLLPLFALAAAWSSLTPARAADCEEIVAYQQAVGPGPVSGPDLPVGIVIHIMERPGHACEVRNVWTSERVAIVFGAGTQDQRNVNSIWGSTRIRFAVHEVVLHEENPPAGMVDSQERINVPTSGPRGTIEYEEAFDLLVGAKHRDHKVNVYLWKRISGKPVGFGRSTRSGHGKATVFLDTRCSQPSVPRCATYAAHELGHTLGLYHAGPGTCSTIDDPLFFPQCTEMAKPCAGVVLKDRLMAPRKVGRMLCPVEVKQAEFMATNEFQ